MRANSGPVMRSVASAIASPSIRIRVRRQIGHAIDRDRRHAGRAVRQRLQRLLGDQPADGLAHRHGAGGQRIGETPDRQHLAGLEEAADQGARRSSELDAVLHRLAAHRHELGGGRDRWSCHGRGLVDIASQPSAIFPLRNVCLIL